MKKQVCFHLNDDGYYTFHSDEFVNDFQFEQFVATALNMIRTIHNSDASLTHVTVEETTSRVIETHHV